MLTLPEFADVAAHAVEASGAAPGNRQAKAIPAARMIRYYTARGLLPRPGARGRALVYGRRHLLQLVAIKRLQGDGLSLDEIAERLEGLSDSDVERLAAIEPEAVPANLGDVDSAMSTEVSRRAERFWDTATADAPPAAGPTPHRAAPAVAASPSGRAAPTARTVTELCLSESVRLLVEDDGSGIPDLDALRTAAGPLLQLLAANATAPNRKDDS